MTRRLITFSRGGDPLRRVVFLTPLLRETASRLLNDSKVTLEYRIPDDLWPVEIDEEQMAQVIRHLLTNAQEAMSQCGIVTISAENAVVERDSVLPLKEGRYVRWSIRDRGKGIPEMILQKIFDPYFSTKQMGTEKGTGLGLAICYSIVKKHHGMISVDSEPENGATFHVCLPASSLGTDVKRNEKGPAVTKGKILIMDDEEPVREMTGSLLNRLGYETEMARDGREAVAMYTKAREGKKPFNAVILDLTIRGGMGGDVAIQRLLEVDPRVRAMIMTGYTDDPIATDFKKHGFRACLTKPFTKLEMVRGLEKLLARP